MPENPASINSVMRNPHLNTVILRGMASSINRMEPEKINEEGEKALLEVEAALENLKSSIIALKIIEQMEENEKIREFVVAF
jgi:hypothetical protein